MIQTHVGQLAQGHLDSQHLILIEDTWRSVDSSADTNIKQQVTLQTVRENILAIRNAEIR